MHQADLHGNTMEHSKLSNCIKIVKIDLSGNTSQLFTVQRFRPLPSLASTAAQFCSSCWTHVSSPRQTALWSSVRPRRQTSIASELHDELPGHKEKTLQIAALLHCTTKETADSSSKRQALQKGGNINLLCRQHIKPSLLCCYSTQL